MVVASTLRPARPKLMKYPILSDPAGLIRIMKENSLEFLMKDKFFTTLLSIWGVSIFFLLWRIRQRRRRMKKETYKRDNKSKAGAAAKKKRKKKPKVDRVFFGRLWRILKICIPGLWSKETAVLAIQFLALVMRSILSIRMFILAGQGQTATLNFDMKGFIGTMAQFIIFSITCSGVNSSLKFLSNLITVMFRRRITEHIHKKYMDQRNYYHFRAGQADQRIVEDLKQFCEVAADIYNKTFKPALDVFFCTERMARKLNLGTIFFLYSYFGVVNQIVTFLSPNFSAMIAQTSHLEGEFHNLHNRISTNAEEIAFLNGAAHEEEILNSALHDLSEHNSYFFFQKFFQGIGNQFFYKYTASMIGWPTLALPFLFYNEGLAVVERAALYRENDRMIQNACASVGDLLMIGKKLQTLSGHTARVSELLEAVEENMERQAASTRPLLLSKEGKIEFNMVSIQTPEARGRTLIRELQLHIKPGENVIVTGPNGAGKTSLFRVLAGLWQASDGQIRTPAGAKSDGTLDMFYVPQKPYMVKGTLRDQITYPSCCPGSVEVDRKVTACLDYVDLGYKLNKPETGGLDRTEFDWTDVLSGGEKQRIGIARLFYHKPKYAVLDEATSAINVTDEGPLYQKLLDMNITVFSIAHRIELKKFHTKELQYSGDGHGNWRLIDLMNDEEAARSSFREQSAESLVHVTADTSPETTAT